MKTIFKVFAGFVSPHDRSGKPRPAILLGVDDEERLALAPCTTWSLRNDLKVPFGAVLFRASSPAYAGTNLPGEGTSISIRDTTWIRLGSPAVRRLKHVGNLDLSLDSRLRAIFFQVLEEYSKS